MGRKRYNLTDDNKHLKSMDEWKLQPLDESLIIIPEEKFIEAQTMIEERKVVKGQSTDAPTSSKLLLSGIAVCGYCNHKLKADYSIKKYKRKTDGEITKTYQPRYRCHYSANTKHPKANFGAVLYEKQFEETLIKAMSNLNLNSFREGSNKLKAEKLTDKITQLNKFDDHIKTKLRQLGTLNDEVANSLLGESKFTPDQLSKAIEKTEDDIRLTKEHKMKLEEEITLLKIQISTMKEIVDDVIDWVPKYKNADRPTKKIMISKIVKEVKFTEEDVEIMFEFNIQNLLMGNSLGVQNHSNSDSKRGTSTLPEIMDKHLERQRFYDIEFEIKSNLDIHS
jgi:hypothetical protein